MTATPLSSGWDFLSALDSPVPADVRGTLEELGVEVVRESEGPEKSEILARCPMHEARTGHRDAHPSFWVNTCTGCFICFSCQYQGAFTQLVMDAYGMTQQEAGLWVVSRRGGAGRRQRKAAPPAERYVYGDVEYSRMSEPPLAELRARGIKRVAAQAYGLRWKDGAWIIPIRNQHGELMGWQEKNGRSFMNRPAEIKKSQSLFGWNRFTAGSVAILVESPLDAVRIASIGIPGAVAAYGALVSDAQMMMIKRSASSLILALDNDRAGHDATAQLYRRWSAYGLKILLFNYAGTTGKDPGELTDEQIEHGIETAHSPRRFRVHG